MNSSRKMLEARQKLSSIPKCGAFARSTGLSCRKPGIGAAGRCRHHGGKSTGRPRIHGNYSIETKRYRDWCRLLLGLIHALHGRAPQARGWIKPNRLLRQRIIELLKWRGITPPKNF